MKHTMSSMAWLVVFGMSPGCSTTTTTGASRGPEPGNDAGDRAIDTPNGDESSERSAIQPVTIGAETLAAESIDGLCDNVEADDDVWVPSAGDFVLRDAQTGSLWNLRGQAFEGPCKGAQLDQVPGYTVFWFSWSATHHGGEIWNRDEKNMPGEIEPDPDGPCNVPCEEIRSGGPPPDGIPALDHEGRWEHPKAQAMVEPDAPEAEYLSDSAWWPACISKAKPGPIRTRFSTGMKSISIR